MKKTGLEIVEMIAKGKAPKKIKNSKSFVYEFAPNIKTYYIDGDVCLDLIQCLNEEFEIIEEDKVWRPLLGEKYYFIDKFNNADWAMWNNTIIDNYKYEIGNCFKTQEETKKEIEKTIIKKKLERYALEHNTEKIDWKNPDQIKWCIVFHPTDNKYFIDDTNRIMSINQVYFTSYELCQQAIQEIGEDNIKKLFEE